MTAQLLQQYGLSDAKATSVPLNAGVKLTKAAGDVLDQAKYPYSQLVGSLLYLANCTRPDIAHAVGVLAKYMPSLPPPLGRGSDVLRYLAGTTIMECALGEPGNFELVGYCDADYAGDLDTRRSTTGYVFISMAAPSAGQAGCSRLLPSRLPRRSTWLLQRQSRRRCG